MVVRKQLGKGKGRRKKRGKKTQQRGVLGDRVVTIVTSYYGAVAVDRSTQKPYTLETPELSANTYAPYGAHPHRPPPQPAPPSAVHPLLSAKALSQELLHLDSQHVRSIQESIKQELGRWALTRAEREARLLWKMEAARYGSSSRLGHHPNHPVGGSRPVSAATYASAPYCGSAGINTDLSAVAGLLPRRPQTALPYSTPVQRADAAAGDDAPAAAASARPRSAAVASGSGAQHRVTASQPPAPVLSSDAAAAAALGGIAAGRSFSAGRPPPSPASALSRGLGGALPRSAVRPSSLAGARASAGLQEGGDCNDDDGDNGIDDDDDGFIQEDDGEGEDHELDALCFAHSRTVAALHPGRRRAHHGGGGGAGDFEEEDALDSGGDGGGGAGRGRPASAPEPVRPYSPLSNPLTPRHLVLSLAAVRRRRREESDTAAAERSRQQSAAAATAEKTAAAAAAAAAAASQRAAGTPMSPRAAAAAARRRAPASAAVRSLRPPASAAPSAATAAVAAPPTSARTAVGGWRGGGSASSAQTAAAAADTAAARSQSAGFAAWLRRRPAAARAVSAVSSARTEGLEDPLLAYQQLELESRRAPRLSAAALARVDAAYGEPSSSAQQHKGAAAGKGRSTPSSAATMRIGAPTPRKPPQQAPSKPSQRPPPRPGPGRGQKPSPAPRQRGAAAAAAAAAAAPDPAAPRRYASAEDFMLHHFPDGAAASMTAAAAAAAAAAEDAADGSGGSSGNAAAAAAAALLSPLALVQEAEAAAVAERLARRGISAQPSAEAIRRALVLPQDRAVERCLCGGRAELAEAPLGGWPRGAAPPPPSPLPLSRGGAKKRVAKGGAAAKRGRLAA